jgi:hypothetical protein
MITFASCFTIGKAHRWKAFPKCEGKFNYHLLLNPLFGNCPSIALYTQDCFGSIVNSLLDNEKGFSLSHVAYEVINYEKPLVLGFY